MERAVIQGLQVLAPRHPLLTRGLWGAVVAVAIFTVTGALKQWPSVTTDAGWGVLAAEQAARGLGGTPVAVRMADPDDLSRSVLSPITWWAPSYGWAPYIFRSMGMSMGEALRATFLAAWGLTVLGWIGVFHQSGLGGARLAALALVFVATRFVHSNAATYEGGELLLLATFPWAVLLTLFAWRPAAKVDAAGFSFSAGLFLPVLYLVKYSAAIAAAAVVLAWVLQTARGGVSWKRLAIFALGAGAGSLLLDAWGNLGANSPISHPWDGRVRWEGLWFFGYPPLAPTDLDALLRWLLLHPSRPVVYGEVILVACGGILFLALLGLALARPADEGGVVSVSSCPAEIGLRERLARAGRAFRGLGPPQLLALTLAWVVPAVLAGMVMRGDEVSVEARHLRPAILPGLALVFGWLVDRSRITGGAGRWVARGLLVALFLVPLVYGVATLVDKTLIRAPSSRGLVGMCGVRLDELTQGVTATEFREDLQRISGGRRAVIWLPTPTLATELVEERLIVTQANFETVAEISRLKYRGRPEGGVIVVYQDPLARDGRLAAVLRAFRDIPASSWRHQKLPRCPGWNAAVGGEQ